MFDVSQYRQWAAFWLAYWMTVLIILGTFLPLTSMPSEEIITPVAMLVIFVALVGFYWLARTHIYGAPGPWFVEIATLCFALFLIFVGYLQWRTLDKTDQTLRLQQRAWIAPSRLIPPQNFIDQKDEDAAIGLAFQNVGKDPAIKVNEAIGVDIIPADRWRDGNFIKEEVARVLEKRCEDVAPSPNGRTIFPGSLPARYIDLEASKAVKASKDKTHFVFVVGCFAYQTFNGTHRSRFCGVLAPPNRSNDNKWQTVLCEVYNDAD